MSNTYIIILIMTLLIVTPLFYIYYKYSPEIIMKDCAEKAANISKNNQNTSFQSVYDICVKREGWPNKD